MAAIKASPQHSDYACVTVSHPVLSNGDSTVEDEAAVRVLRQQHAHAATLSGRGPEGAQEPLVKKVPGEARDGAEQGGGRMAGLAERCGAVRGVRGGFRGSGRVRCKERGAWRDW